MPTTSRPGIRSIGPTTPRATSTSGGKATASLSTKRSGKTVTLSAKTKRYDPESYGWVNYNPKVKFQVKKGGQWKTVKTIKAKKGKATYKYKSKGKKSYRVVFDQVSWATGAKSKTVKK